MFSFIWHVLFMLVPVAAEGNLPDNVDRLCLILPPTGVIFSDPIVSNFSARRILFVDRCVGFENVVMREDGGGRRGRCRL